MSGLSRFIIFSLLLIQLAVFAHLAAASMVHITGEYITYVNAAPPHANTTIYVPVNSYYNVSSIQNITVSTAAYGYPVLGFVFPPFLMAVNTSSVNLSAKTVSIIYKMPSYSYTGNFNLEASYSLTPITTTTSISSTSTISQTGGSSSSTVQVTTITTTASSSTTTGVSTSIKQVLNSQNVSVTFVATGLKNGFGFCLTFWSCAPNWKITMLSPAGYSVTANSGTSVAVLRPQYLNSSYSYNVTSPNGYTVSSSPNSFYFNGAMQIQLQFTQKPCTFAFVVCLRR